MELRKYSTTEITGRIEHGALTDAQAFLKGINGLVVE